MAELKIDIVTDVEPGFILAKFDYFPPLLEAIKAFPGTRWEPKKRGWLIPAELRGVLFDHEPVAVTSWSGDARLYDFQSTAVARIIQDRRFLLFFEPGVGKTPPTICALAEMKPKRVLVVCPAIVRQHWQSELGTWWADHPTVERVKTNEQAKAIAGPGIFIVSYEMLDSVPTENWDAIVLDEIHYIKNSTAKRSKAAQTLIAANPSAMIVGLTGTPITSEPMDIHNIVNTVWPRRFGGRTKFGDRYCKVKANKYAYSGKEYIGLHPQTADELNDRLAHFSSRVTKAEVAHLLPVLQTELYRYDRMNDTSEIVALTEYGLTQDSHICILTHEIQRTYDLADALENALPPGTAIIAVNGEQTADARLAEITTAKLAKRAVVVATMHSITTGIDLTKFTRVIFAQLYWSPAVMMQALGRFPRINAAGHIYQAIFMVQRNSQDELIARALRERVGNIIKLIGAGHGEQTLANVFEMSKEEEQKFLADLKNLANGIETDFDFDELE